MDSPRLKVSPKNYSHWMTDSRVTHESGTHTWVYVYVSYNFRSDANRGPIQQRYDWDERARFRFTNEADIFVISLLKDLEQAGYVDIEVHIKE